MPFSIDGFLGTRATFMLDVVVLAMIVVLPVLSWSIYQAKYRAHYGLHKVVQVTLAVVLLITVALFEADIRINGWRERALASPFSGQDGSTDWVALMLGIHLCFAVTTALLWIAVTVRALREFSSPPVPGAHSRWHRRWGMAAAIDMAGTAVTGWMFYWMAFVA